MERTVTGREYAAFTVPVPGGAIVGGQWHPDAGGTPVLAVHGVTASHRAFSLLAAELDARIIAPDLRGRGRSNGLPGPFALTRQADDLALVLEALGVERAVVVGHSMGAFVAVRLAERHPGTVASLVLVDGGLPILPPPGVTAEAFTAATLGPALTRLSMEFDTVDEYLEFWRAHPAVGPWWSEAIADYVRYDLDGTAPHLRASTSAEAVAENTAELDGSGGYAAALAGVAVDVDVLLAPRGLLDGDPLYGPGAAAALAADAPALRLRRAVDVNHYTIVMTEPGVAQLAPAITAQLARADAAAS